MSSTYLLTGDIGGTNSRMALYDVNTNPHSKPRVEKYYRNTEQIPSESYNDPEIFQTKIITAFVKHCWEECETVILPPLHSVQIIATLAVAGFVLQNRVHLTNLGNMLVDGTAIGNNTNNKYLKPIIVCRIINDFVAVRP